MTRPSGMVSLPPPATITAAARGAIGVALGPINTTTPSSNTSPWSDAANTMIAFPFVVESQTLVNKFFWVNGSSVGGNFEVVLYDEAFGKVGTSTGSVVSSGASVPQVAAPSGGAFTIPPGSYYCAIAHDDTTTNRIFRWGPTNGIGYLMALGCWKQAVTLGSLPSTATPADLTVAALPVYGFTTRTAFDV